MLEQFLFTIGLFDWFMSELSNSCLCLGFLNFPNTAEFHKPFFLGSRLKTHDVFVLSTSQLNNVASNVESLLLYFSRALDAGPVVLIVTALTLIFSIGLSDDENKGELSAYSVFNRGFEQLMGSVDADALLAQHVGGGFMMNMNQHNDAPDRHRNRENAEPPNLLRHDNDDNQPVVANDNEDNVRQNDNELNNNNRARKSGKKARRRNLDQRRDLRRQREAAIQMDLDEVRGGIDGAVDVQRVIEEQIAFENNR